jgi:peptidoglycan/LPS O-acetylase OafA/YrhL
MTAVQGGEAALIPPRPHTRVPQLDGMRAVAVLLVFGAHTVTRGFGWQGVHLFFVLSGFLITGILRRSRSSGAYWRTFYLKRSTRILPPLLIFFLWGLVLYSPSWKILPAYMLFGANIASASRFDLRNAFDVLWSLSVEEHFYLLWPFAVRFCTRSQLIRLSLAICLVEPFLRMAFTHVVPDARAIYMLTPFQLDGLAGGSLVALLFERERAREQVGRLSLRTLWVALVVYTGLALASHSFGFSANSLLFNGLGYSLVAVISVSVLAELYLHPRAILSRMLSSPALVFLGTISYGFYLFHPLMLDLLERLFPIQMSAPKTRLLMAGIALAASIVISWISFRFYESYVTRWGRRTADRMDSSHPVITV